MDRRHYYCKFEGCDKSFLRKEHLARHERTHNPAALHICQVCQKSFNRSDSLLRHLALHGESYKAAPSGRSKRACLNCRAGKIKCDGNEQCTGCLKRGVDCHYRQQNGEISAASTESQDQRISLSPVREHFQNPSSEATTPPVLPPIALEQPSSHSPICATIDVSTPTVIKSNGVVDWGSIKVRKDPENPFKNDPLSEKYLNSYFQHAHHRWPIVHRAAYITEDDAQSVNSAMKMIGAWLVGTEESRQYALDIYKKLVVETQSRLCKITFQDQFQQTFSSGICEATLLCIVFGLYYGEAKNLAQISILRNILISCLRAVRFFQPETAFVDERPGYFLPLHLLKRESRARSIIPITRTFYHANNPVARLTAYLLKIDIYLSIIQNQPPVLTLEECHFPMPSTYPLYNSNGLPNFEQRLAVEPSFRGQTSLFDMVQKANSEFPNETNNPLLIEDLQICICSMDSSIWMLSDPTCSSKDCEIGVVLQKDALRRRLDILKHRLDQFSKQDAYDAETFERNYYGWEGDLRGTAVERIKSLTFDTTILYHLFSLHLQADIGSLTHLAKNQNLSKVEKLSERHGKLRERRKLSAVSWAGAATARQALCHAVDILVTLQSIQKDGKTTKPDPIAYIAISTAALVVWAYCTFGTDSCDTCVPGIRRGGHALELTEWSAQADLLNKEKETWIEMGGACQVHLQGIQMCGCASEFYMTLFKDQLPGEWGIADVIAPGIFKRSEG